MDYGITVALAGMSHVARYGEEWLYNFYQVHRDWVNYDKGPYAFVVPTGQRDPYAAFEMLDSWSSAPSRLPRHRSPPRRIRGILCRDGNRKALRRRCSRQVYPDRLFPGGPRDRRMTSPATLMLMGALSTPPGPDAPSSWQ
jgi:hypothetical protein